MIIVKSATDLAGMRAAGRVAALVRDEVARIIGPGMTAGELSDCAVELMKKNGAESAFRGYRGYPGDICVSVNDGVVHGVPGKRKIRLGDIVSIDIGVKYEGFVGDTATTVMVGVTDSRVVNLVKVTERALEAGISVARAGRRLSDISNAIEQVAIGAGYSVVRQFVGHGIGRQMHEDPEIPNFGLPGRGPILKAGMTFCLEPMVNMGGADVKVEADGWTVVTLDGSPSAHFEHVIVVNDDEAEILTL